VCEPFIVPFFGEREGQEPRTRDINEPAPTVTTNNRMGLCEPFLVRLKIIKTVDSVDDPLKTLTTKESYALAEPYLVKFYGNEKGAESIDEPLDTVTAKTASVYAFRRSVPCSIFGFGCCSLTSSPQR
jgi:DNA (cytosine-5)-methyltransferase 1